MSAEPLGPPAGRGPAYHFTDVFTIDAPRERVHDVLLDLEGYVAWWPQIRAVASLGPDDARVICRSALPYDLDLRLHAVSRDPGRLEVSVDGPFHGSVRWTLHDETPTRTRLEWDQWVRVGSPVLALASYVGRPVLRWNHAKMMAGARDGLRRTLA